MNDEELDGLLSRAKRDVPSQAELDALGARLGLSPGSSGGGAPAAPPRAGIAGRVLAGRALAALLAALVPVTSWLAWSRFTAPASPSGVGASAPSETASVPRGSDESAEVSTADSVPTDLTPDEAAPTSIPAAPRRARRPPRRRPEVALDPAASPGVSEPARESEVSILGRASRALRGADFAGARAALAEHARLYPAGILAEERESLEVELALRSGAMSARAALEAFRRRHPRSGHLPRLERLAAERAAP